MFTLHVRSHPSWIYTKKKPNYFHLPAAPSLIINSREGQWGWRKDGHPGKQLNGLMDGWKVTVREMGRETEKRERQRDLQMNVHKQTACQRRTRLGQTEGQINRRTTVQRPTNRDRQCFRQTDGQTQQGDRRLVRQDRCAVHLLSESSRTVVCALPLGECSKHTLCIP